MNQSTHHFTAVAPPYAPDFTLGDVLGVLRRYWVLVLVTTLGMGAAGYHFASGIAPNYQAEALMISDMQRSGFMETAQDRDLSMSDSALTTTIVETFTTPVVIDRLIASLTPETRARLETAAFAHLSPSDLAGIDKRPRSNGLCPTTLRSPTPGVPM